MENSLPGLSFLPNLTRVRFGDLFDYLEHDFTLSADRAVENPAGGGDRLDATFTTLFLRAKRSRTRATVGMVGGQVLSLRPQGVGPDWVSGSLGEARARGVILPLGSMEWVEVSPGDTGGVGAQMAPARFRDVLADLSHRRQPVEVHLPSGAVVGIVTTVGLDYVDVRRVAPSGVSLRRINLTAVSMVTVVDPLHWG